MTAESILGQSIFSTTMPLLVSATETHLIHEFGDYERGQIKVIEREADLVISIHWPFDRKLDEWIDVSIPIEVDDIERVSLDTSALIADADSSSSRIELISSDGGDYLLSVRGWNTLGRVSAEIRIPIEMGRELMDLLRSLAS